MRLESRAAQTSAICSSSFAWAQNSKGASPCQVAASVDALCNNGSECACSINLYPNFMSGADWVIGALNSTVQYANPNPVNGTTSVCTWYVASIAWQTFILNEMVVLGPPTICSAHVLHARDSQNRHHSMSIPPSTIFIISYFVDKVDNLFTFLR